MIGPHDDSFDSRDFADPMDDPDNWPPDDEGRDNPAKASFDDLIEICRERIRESMSNNDRIEFLDRIFDGYCRNCGGEEPDLPCRCEDDE
jgi:hypothetical protein